MDRRIAQANFIRDVQITGDMVTGDVYIAGMDEGGEAFPTMIPIKFSGPLMAVIPGPTRRPGSPFAGPGV